MPTPLKLTPAKLKEICDLVRHGHFEYPAAALCEVPKSTYTWWKQQGEAHRAAGRRTRYTKFLDAVERALHAAEHDAVTALRGSMVGRVKKAGICEACGAPWEAVITVPKLLKAATFWLERKAPERWGRRDRLEVTNAIDRDALEGLLGEMGEAAHRAILAAGLEADLSERLVNGIAEGWFGVLEARYPGIVGRLADASGGGSGAAGHAPRRLAAGDGEP